MNRCNEDGIETYNLEESWTFCISIYIEIMKIDRCRHHIKSSFHEASAHEYFGCIQNAFNVFVGVVEMNEKCTVFLTPRYNVRVTIINGGKKKNKKTTKHTVWHTEFRQPFSYWSFNQFGKGPNIILFIIIASSFFYT